MRHTSQQAVIRADNTGSQQYRQFTTVHAVFLINGMKLAFWRAAILHPGVRCVHTRRVASRHTLPLRQAGCAVAPGRGGQACAALPYSDPLVFDASRAGRTLYQLATGRIRQLPGTIGLSREDARVQGHRRPDRRNGRLQPVRLLSGTVGRAIPVRVFGRARRRACAVPRQASNDAALCRVRREHRPDPDGDRRLPRRAEPAAAAGNPLPDPHGAWRADAGGDAGQRSGIVPRLRLAAGRDTAATGVGGAFRIRLSAATRARRQIDRWPERHRSRLHRPARVVRGVSAGRGLDRLRSDLRPAGGRRAYPGGVHAGAGQRRADLRRGR
jgi:hypothetical protein